MRYDEMKMDEMLQLEAEKTHMIWVMAGSFGCGF